MMKASLLALLLLGATAVYGQSRRVQLDDDLEIKLGGGHDDLSKLTPDSLKQANIGRAQKVAAPEIVKTERLELE
jgi:hypothetical protein